MQRNYFKQMIQAANRRLERMSRGQFILECKSLEELGKRGEAGLDLDVYSLVTDQVQMCIRDRYDALLEVRIDNARTRARLEGEMETRESWTPDEAFRHFYQEMNQCPISEQEEAIMKEIFEKAEER